MKPITISDAAWRRFRDAASQFTRDVAPRASRLLPVKADIVALRAKGASFRAISELLQSSGIVVSATCVMRFCHRQLEGKPSRGVKRKQSVAPKAAPGTNDHPAPSAALTEAANAALLDGLLSAVPPNLSPKLSDADGPRIAKIEFAKPDPL